MKSKSADPLNARNKMNHFVDFKHYNLQSVRTSITGFFECILLVVSLKIQRLKIVQNVLEKSNNTRSQSDSFEVVLVNHKA